MSINVKALIADELIMHWVLAEEILLAALTFDPKAIREFPDVEVDDFFDLRNQRLFMAMRNIELRGDDVTTDGVYDELKAMDERNAKWQERTYYLEHCMWHYVELLTEQAASSGKGSFTWAGIAAAKLLRALRIRRERLAA